MRSWRKLHSKVIFSERAPLLSDSALTLFFLLVMVQDDNGYYPWTPQAVRSFTLSRTWSFEQTTELANELVAAGMAFWDKDATGIVLDRGEELNGRLRKAREALTYRNRPVVQHETPPDALGTEADRRLPLSVQRPPIDQTRLDKEEESEKEKEEEAEAEPGESDADSPIHFQGDILGHYSSQELLDLRGSFPLFDLEFEAERCFAWYKGKGDSIRDARGVFRNWPGRARPPNRSLPPSEASHTMPPSSLSE